MDGPPAARRDRPARVGLVLTGGGARGAYQAGVLRGIADVTGAVRSPFGVVTGVSAGAINAMAIAAGADDFTAATGRLWDTWLRLGTRDVFRTDVESIVRIGARWLRDLALGGLFGGSRSTHLLDTTPLREMLGARIDLARIATHLDAGLLSAVAVSATNYGSGVAVTFFDGEPSLVPWRRGNRLARRAPIELPHVMASSAIPLFFPPERLDGCWYGDGCVRLATPLSPAIHLGAERVLAVGVRHGRTPDEAARLCDVPAPKVQAIDIAGVVLNAVFLDSLDADVERLRRINRTLALLPDTSPSAHPDALRPIQICVVRPSRDLGLLASHELPLLPGALRYMLRGIGASGDKGWDVLSYLAFESAYTRVLLELGRADVRARADEIAAFLAPSASGMEVGDKFGSSPAGHHSKGV